MTIADQLGTGSSFGNVRRSSGRSARGRAKAVAQGDAPIYELVRLPLESVAPTPLNPRRNFGTDEDKTRFGEELRHAQLAACVAVTIGAYLELWPEQREELGDVAHVLVNGERRYRSAVHVGLEALDFVVRDDLASSKEDFINHLLKENLEREDFDVIERARGVQQMVDVCEEGETGARARAAAKLGRDRSWVTNQLALLRLPAEIQAMLSSGELPERDGRQIARYAKRYPDVPAADLLRHWKGFKIAEAKEREREKALLQAAKEGEHTTSGPVVLSADNAPAPPAPGPDTDTDSSATPAEHADNPPAPALSPTNDEADAARASESSTATKLASETGKKPRTAAVPRQGDNPLSPAAVLVQQLGETSADRAKTLAAGLSQSDLLALVEELRSYL